MGFFGPALGLRRYPRRQCPHLFRPGLPNGTNEKKHEALDEDLIDQFGAMADASGGSVGYQIVREELAARLSAAQVGGFDSATGLILSSETVENRERHGQSYRVKIEVKAKRMSWNGVIDPAVFRVPSGYAEVKELSRWDAKKMKKELTGKPAPDLALMDINGKPVKLSDLRGKTVLLDFWATWCGPCRADGPSLDKLAKKYGGKSLQIIGVSVDEDRATVQKFLKEHPHEYPIALTTENEMPRAYQIGVFPTYVIIDSEGNFADATEGDSGFSKLKKLLGRAGLDTE